MTSYFTNFLYLKHELFLYQTLCWIEMIINTSKNIETLSFKLKCL